MNGYLRRIAARSSVDSEVRALAPAASPQGETAGTADPFEVTEAQASPSSRPEPVPGPDGVPPSVLAPPAAARAETLVPRAPTQLAPFPEPERGAVPLEVEPPRTPAAAVEEQSAVLPLPSTPPEALERVERVERTLPLLVPAREPQSLPEIALAPSDEPERERDDRPEPVPLVPRPPPDRPLPLPPSPEPAPALDHAAQIEAALARVDRLLRPELPRQAEPPVSPPAEGPVVSIGRIRVEVVHEAQRPAPSAPSARLAPRAPGRTASLLPLPSKLRFGLGQG